jgi:hypothetical protein
VIRAAIALLVIVMLAGTSRADEREAKEAARQVLITLRILAYDKALADRRPGHAVTIAVVSSSTSSGRRAREVWQAGFALLPKVKVGGRPIKVVAFDFASKAAFEAALATHAPAAVIIADDLDKVIPEMRAATRKHKSLTITTRQAALKRGLSVAVVSGQERDEISINLEASRAEGVRFGAGLLQLARLVEEAP